MKYKKQSHCVYYCDYHVVITTKYRHKVINEGVYEYMHKSLEGIRKHYGELEIKEINHDKDHVHMLISIPPKWSVGGIIRIIKLNTAKSLKGKFEHIKKAYWGVGGIWSDGYFVSTVGVNKKVIEEYIKHQGEEDFGQAKPDLG